MVVVVVVVLLLLLLLLLCIVIQHALTLNIHSASKTINATQLNFERFDLETFGMSAPFSV